MLIVTGIIVYSIIMLLIVVIAIIGTWDTW